MNAPLCLSRISWQRQLGFPFTIGRSREPFQLDDTHLGIFNAQQNAASKFDNVFPLDPTQIVCPNGRCILENERHTVLSTGTRITSQRATLPLLGRGGKRRERLGALTPAGASALLTPGNSHRHGPSHYPRYSNTPTSTGTNITGRNRIEVRAR